MREERRKGREKEKRKNIASFPRSSLYCNTKLVHREETRNETKNSLEVAISMGSA